MSTRCEDKCPLIDRTYWSTDYWPDIMIIDIGDKLTRARSDAVPHRAAKTPMAENNKWRNWINDGAK